MSSEEKRAWVLAVVSAVSYAIYSAIVLGRAGSTPLAHVHYVSTLLWVAGASTVASMVVHMAVTMGNPREAGRKDQRDREIGRFGEYVGRAFLIAGGVAALGMSMAEFAYFWIANVLYLAFTLAAIAASVAKILAYRKGFHPW